MGGFLFQYGTAAHLAILTVAPLFLFAVCGSAMHAQSLLWLSGFAAVWIAMNPATRTGEWPRDARRRIGWEIAHDPFLIFSVVALIVAAVRAINGGIALDYNASTGLWHLKEPHVAVLPGSVSGEGVLPLAGTLALAVVTLGVRHALGGRGRFAYLLLCGILAAGAVVFWKYLPSRGIAVPRLGFGPQDPFYLGSLLGVPFLFAIGAWVTSWLMRSVLLELVAALAAAVLLFGLLSHAPTFAFLAFVAAALPVVALGSWFAYRRRPSMDWCRTAIMLLIIASPGALVAIGELGRPPLWPLFADGFLAVRDAASTVAIEAWKSSSRIGLGLGAYPLAFGFFATAENWQTLSFAQTAVPCGWLHFVFERGFLGAAMLLAGLGILLRDGIVRYVRAGSGWTFRVTHVLGLLVLLPVAAVLFVECSYAQIVALVPVAAALALTAAEFPQYPEEDHG